MVATVAGGPGWAAGIQANQPPTPRGLALNPRVVAAVAGVSQAPLAAAPEVRGAYFDFRATLCGETRQRRNVVGEHRHRPDRGPPVQRIPKSRRYRLTATGRRVAALFTKAYGRGLTPGLTLLSPDLPEEVAARDPLARAWRNATNGLDAFCEKAMVCGLIRRQLDRTWNFRLT